MKKRVKCPKCNTKFDYRANLKEKVTGLTSFVKLISQHRFRPLFSGDGNKDAVDHSNIVVCPKCKFEFSYSEYEYFGVLNISTLKLILIFFIFIIFILVPAYILMRDLIH